MILQLEQNSKQIAQEKQDYIDKLNDAASKLETELERKQVSTAVWGQSAYRHMIHPCVVCYYLSLRQSQRVES